MRVPGFVSAVDLTAERRADLRTMTCCCCAGGKYELLMVDDGELVLGEQDGNVQLNPAPKVAFQV